MFLNAALSLSLDSFIAASGSQIISIVGSALLLSASTDTSKPSKPIVANVFTVCIAISTKKGIIRFYNGNHYGNCKTYFYYTKHMRKQSTKQIMQQFGTSYYYATLFFPQEIKKAVMQLYKLVRIPDQIVDEIQP
jgi:hypothetical protein